MRRRHADGQTEARNCGTARPRRKRTLGKKWMKRDACACSCAAPIIQSGCCRDNTERSGRGAPESHKRPPPPCQCAPRYCPLAHAHARGSPVTSTQHATHSKRGRGKRKNKRKHREAHVRSTSEWTRVRGRGRGVDFGACPSVCRNDGVQLGTARTRGGQGRVMMYCTWEGNGAQSALRSLPKRNTLKTLDQERGG